MKYGVPLLLSFIAGLAIYGYLFHASCDAPTPSLHSAISVSAQDLIGAYDKNETLFDGKYLNKALLVQGIVKKIKHNSGSHYILYLGNDPAEGPSVSCALDSQFIHPPLALKAGDPVTLSGICAGGPLDIVIVQCIIKKS